MQGAELITAFLAIAGESACAPLNTSLTDDGYRFYLSRLGVRILLVQEDFASPAVAAAQHLGIRVLRVHSASHSATGVFTFESEGAWPMAPGRQTDASLLLYSSATTGNPKHSADLCQSRGDRAEQFAGVPVRRIRSVSYHGAIVSFARARRNGDAVILRGRGDLHIGVRPRLFPNVARRLSSHLDFRCAPYAARDPGSSTPASETFSAHPITLHPILRRPGSSRTCAVTGRQCRFQCSRVTA